MKIKKIINITEQKTYPNGLKNDAEHLFQIPVYDSNKAKLFPYFEDAYHFIGIFYSKLYVILNTKIFFNYKDLIKCLQFINF